MRIAINKTTGLARAAPERTVCVQIRSKLRQALSMWLSVLPAWIILLGVAK